MAASPQPMDAALLESAVERACARIAPTWPLDRFIAVNPFWGFIDQPFTEVSARLGALSGSRLSMARKWYRQQWSAGRLTSRHLQEAITDTGSTLTMEQVRGLLNADAEPPAPPRRPKMTDLVDAQRDLVHQVAWRDFVVHSLSQCCAAYFDDGQAQLRPEKELGLYGTWRRQACHDHSPALLMGFREGRKLARALPKDARELIAMALGELEITASEWEAYLTALLLDVNGWAAWCAYLRWTARLEGRSDDHIVQLLAIRLAWEHMLHRAGGGALATRWRITVAAGWPAVDQAAEAAQAHDWVLQRAVEIAYQDELREQLPRGLSAPPVARPSVQAVFCIDVRSEIFRRALEAQDGSVQTLGFAGFFGAPIDYQPLGSPSATPQLPGLLSPRLRATDTGAVEDLAAKRASRLAVRGMFKQFKTSAISGFSFVETLGPLYAGKLVADAWGHTRAVTNPDRAGLSAKEHAVRRPRITATAAGEPLDVAQRTDLALGILRGMSLTRNFARLVLFVGHGSETVNNPHAAGLDCGACCGQSGEVNARAVAALLNDPDVREGLSAHGVEIPAATVFVAGLHNTTRDEVELFELQDVPATHVADVVQVRRWLERAGHEARVERARRLSMNERQETALRTAMAGRARDWSQVRPEWGLADNAALIVAPREHCRHLDLAGRAFLHDYRWQDDEGFAILELIMTAPMVVSHWINMQYYASTVDNRRYGSGNKVLHNVVGGHIGVFEGNGGDLRIGLSIQSLHDGERFVHTPLRLSVFIEAPRKPIEAVIQRHEMVRQLVDNEWLYLFQLDAEERAVYAYRKRQWHARAEC